MVWVAHSMVWLTYLSIVYDIDLHTKIWRHPKKVACRVVMTLPYFRYT